MEFAFRDAGASDVEHVRWALYTALAWNPDRQLPPLETTLDHPEAARYHRDWGRAGDVGVIATCDGAAVGVAYCRLFTDSDHGHGYVDAHTPEVAVAVADAHRGAGLGTRLLRELAEAARARGFTQLSLSVDEGNPALRLYERLGYRKVSTDDDGVRMVLDLALSSAGAGEAGTRFAAR
jgi:ribosomal protein S18 acetylase RimI-like enzyme